MASAFERVGGGVARLLAYVRPTYMLPAVGMSAYGAALAPAAAFDPALAALHAIGVGVALFVAHLRDGLVDGHRRGEETPRLTEAAFRRGIRVGVGVALALAAVLFTSDRPTAAMSLLVLLALALLHAPYLDRNVVTVTVDYPAGIAVVVAGGYAAQAGGLVPSVLAVAAAFAGLLSGIKVGIDRLDADFDRSIGKRTVPVAFGSAGAVRIASGIFALTTLAAVASALAGAAGALALRPGFAAAATVAPLGCLLASATAPPERAVRIQMGLTYVFAALLFLAACGEDAAGAAFAAAIVEAAGS